MVVKEGEKLHIVTRRMLEDDPRRHFAGQIRAVEGDLIRVEGHVFVFNANRNEWKRRADLRTRIMSMSDAANVINVLPGNVDISKLEYRIIDGRLVVTDSATFTLDVNEFNVHR